MAGARHWGFPVTTGRLLIGGCLLLVLLVVVSVWGRNRLLRGRIADEIAAIRAHGEPVTVADLKETYESLPLDQNAAPFLVEAFALLKTNWPKPVHALSRMRAHSPERELREEEMALAHALLEANAPAFERLDEALEKPHAAFQLEWHWDMDLPHLPPFRHLAELLALRIRVLRGEGPQEIVEDVERIIKLAQVLEWDPVPVTHYVRTSLLRTACGSIEYILNAPVELEVAELRALSELLPEQVKFQSSLKAERVFGIQQIRPMTHAGKEFDPDASPDAVPPGEARVLSATGLLLRDHMEYLKYAALFIELSTNGFPSALSSAADLDSEIDKKAEEASEALESFHIHKLGSMTFLTALYASSFVRAFERTAAILAELRMTRVALLLEEHRIRTGQYPPDLEVLAGEIPEEELIDPFTGSPLRYVRKEGGYMLYSLGMDKTDQQGTPSQADRSKRDEPYDLPFTVTLRFK